VTDKGMIIRVPIDQIAQTKRSTQGVKIINVLDGHEVATIAIVPKEEDDDENMESIDDNSEITEETNDNISANQEQQKPIREFHMEEYKELNHFVEEDEEENEEDDEEESDVDDILKDSY